MLLREPFRADAAWIQEQYADIGFLPSDLARETIVIAEIEGQRAGMGRLVPAGEGVFELGGILVLDAFRGRGVARAIVDELIRRAGAAEVYCIPFADLGALYAAAGFRRIDAEGVPEKVREKLAWCERNIDRAVMLMKLTT